MSNSRQIASLPNILTLIDDAGGQFIKQQAAGVTTSYTITWPSAVGSSGAVLALTDGSGGLGWQSTLGIALSGGTVNNSVIGGSTPAAITGTTITANTAFVGPLTGNSTTATALAAGRTFAFTGDATGTSASFDGSANVSTSLTLAASGVSANSYGSATAIPVITVDSKGRITAATTAAISSSLTIGADNGSNDTVTIGTDTLNFVGTGSEIETTVSNNQIQIGLPSTVSGLTTVSATNLQGALAGTIASTTTGATQAASDNSTKIATTAYVTTALANLIDSAPGALNTLNELAAALGDDANFSTTVTNSIATKLALAGGTMTGNLILGDNVKALFGTGSDLEIYHDGSNSYIVDAGTGGILYRGGTQTFQNAAGSKTMAVLNGATSVDLYYDNSKKFETTAAGVTITGTGTATTFSATTLTGTLSTAAQPNVTSVGTLSALTVSGNLNATLTTAAQTNITSVGTLTGLTVNGTANATTFVGALTGNVTGNVSGSAATVTGAAQTNITSLGTLSALTVSGDVTIDTSTLKVDTSNNRVGILNASPDVTLDIGSATDSIHIPVGTTAQRPGSPAAGYFRYNSSLSQFEGYTSAWGAIGGGGTNTFNHNVFTGDGSTTAFALAAATESENNLLVFIDGVFQEQGAYSIATSGGTTTLTMSAAPASGRKLVVYQVSAGVSGNNLNIDTMTGDGSDTTLTLSINPVNENNVQVFFDGVYQNKSTFSVSGTTLTFSTAPPTGVEVEAMTFTQTEVNVPVNDTIDTVHIKDNAVTAGKIEASLDLSGKTLTLPAVAVPSASTATTQSASDNTTKIATTAYVTTAIAALIDGAPGTLNTLNELAAALADDASFSSSVTTSLAAKANLAAPNFTGNVTFDSTTLTVDATNNRVGIGTASPTHPLEVTIDSSGAQDLLILSNDNTATSNSASLLFAPSNGIAGARIEALAMEDFSTSANRTADLLFYTRKDGTLAEKMRIDSSGNVGIGTGTASPDGTLHVKDAVAQVYIQSNDGQPSQIVFGDVSDASRGRINYDSSDNMIFENTNLQERMRIAANGNVGINTTDPSAIFEVRATAPTYTNNGTVFWGGTTNNDAHNGIMLSSYGDALAGSIGSNLNHSNGTVSQTNTNRSSAEIQFSNTTTSSVTSSILFGGYVKGSTTFTERMRIDNNGNVGIGTSSPSGPLNVHSASGDANLYVTTGNTAASTNIFFGDSGNSTIGRIVYDHNGDYMKFRTNGSDAMRIDSSGNVGIGSNNPSQRLETNGNIFINAPSGNPNLTIKTGGAGNNPHINYRAGDNTVFDTMLVASAATDYWRVGYGASGSVTSELLAVTSDGDVGIGTTGPAKRMEVRGGTINGDIAAFNTVAGRGLIISDFAVSGTNAAGIDFNATDVGGQANLSFSTRDTERMRIDSIGNVGIGTDSPDSPLEIQAATNSSSDTTYLKLFNAGENVGHIDFENGNGSLARITGTKEGSGASANDGILTFSTALDASLSVALTIDSNGRLLVAQTSGVGIGGTPADVNGTEIGKGYINLNRDDTASANQIQFGKNGAVAGRITTTTTTSYVETSDRRVKSNIADAEDCGAAIDSMQVRKFDWTESGEHHPFGMIAQELLEIAPIAVDVPDDPSEMMGVDYSKLVPMLVKEIQALRTRVQELENN